MRTRLPALGKVGLALLVVAWAWPGTGWPDDDLRWLEEWARNGMGFSNNSQTWTCPFCRRSFSINYQDRNLAARADELGRHLADEFARHFSAESPPPVDLREFTSGMAAQTEKERVRREEQERVESQRQQLAEERREREKRRIESDRQDVVRAGEKPGSETEGRSTEAAEEEAAASRRPVWQTSSPRQPVYTDAGPARLSTDEPADLSKDEDLARMLSCEPFGSYVCAVCGQTVPCNGDAVREHALSHGPKAWTGQTGVPPAMQGTEPSGSGSSDQAPMATSGPVSATTPASRSSPTSAGSKPPAAGAEPVKTIRCKNGTPLFGEPCIPVEIASDEPARATPGAAAQTPSPKFTGFFEAPTPKSSSTLVTADLKGPEEPPEKPCRAYAPYRTGVVEGTSWIAGFNVRRDARNAAMRAEAYRKLFDQLRLAGKFENKADADRVVELRRLGRAKEAKELQDALLKTVFDPTDYDFLIAVGADYDWKVDIAKRVAGDSITHGGTSAKRPLYASLRGRQFDVLDCHSSGGMVCLAALSGDCPDARANHVRLFAPQITPSAARQWEELIETGKVKSVQLYINKGDPITPLSYASGGIVDIVDAMGRLVTPERLRQVAAGIRGTRVMASYEAPRDEINRVARGIRITFFDDCPERELQSTIEGFEYYDWTWACHNWMRYQRLVKGQ